MNNLLKRSIFGTLFLVVSVGCLLCPCGYAALMTFVIVTTAVELFRMLVPGPRYTREKAMVLLCCVSAFVLAFAHFYAGMEPRFILCSLLPLTAAFILMLFDSAKDYDFQSSLFMPVVYIAVPVCCSLFLAFPKGDFTWTILLGMFILIWSCDVGAYCFGMLFGQKEGSRKLFPAISPKKSWAGVYGGFLCTLLAAFLVSRFFGDILPLVHWMAIALFVSTIGVIGDLFESLIKRHSGVKDSGNIIPGHGGMLDRYDDILFLLPVISAYLKLFNVI